jgi:hypothetical protein
MNLNEIFIVIVLYKSTLEESKTIQTLVDAVEERINLMVFDNSPIRQCKNDNFEFKNFNVQYYHDGTNPGLSTAYNSALDECSKLNKKWILLLDQDTTFTKEYIEEIKSLDFNEIPDTVVAIIPKVVSLLDERIIAPVKMFLGGICRPVEIVSGVVNTSISGINSGTLLNVFYLNSIKGFSMKYTLDMLDHWYFRKIFNDGKSFYLLNSDIKQDLSVFGNFEENISFGRYEQMLNAEVFFIEEEGLLSLLVFKFRLFFRLLKQFRYKNSAYYKFTLKIFLRVA